MLWLTDRPHRGPLDHRCGPRQAPVRAVGAAGRIEERPEGPLPISRGDHHGQTSQGERSAQVGRHGETYTPTVAVAEKQGFMGNAANFSIRAFLACTETLLADTKIVECRPIKKPSEEGCNVGRGGWI